MTYFSDPYGTRFPARPGFRVQGHCEDCDHRTAVYADRWMVVTDPASKTEIRVDENATFRTSLGDDLTLAQAASDSRLREVHSLVCNSCGAFNEGHRVFRRNYFEIVALVGCSLTLGAVFAGPAAFAIELVLASVSAWLFLGVYALIRLIRYPWSFPPSCGGCGGGPLLPTITQIGRKLPCPECGSRTFRYLDVDRTDRGVGDGT